MAQVMSHCLTLNSIFIKLLGLFSHPTDSTSVKKLAILCSIPLATLFSQNESISPQIRPGYESIRSGELQAYESVLTADSLEGRETSYPGQRRAATYIASLFQQYGMRPIGDSGTYFQHFSVDVVRPSPDSRIIVSGKNGTEQYSFEKDFVAGPSDTTVHGKLVFVGFADSHLDSVGRRATEGNIVLMFSGGRSSTGDTGQLRVRRRLFAGRRDRGIAATLVIVDDHGSASFDALKELLFPSGVSRGRMQLHGEGRSTLVPAPVLFISPEFAKKLAQQFGKTIEGLRALATNDTSQLPLTSDDCVVTVAGKLERELRQTENVVGFLEGSDSLLRNQAVVFSAHYDHLGVGTGGAIFHGADDDGSGTSMILALAHAFSHNPAKPKRSLVFLTVTGEEKGLLGSAYYTSHPLIPLNQTIADLNTDMIGRVDPEHERQHVTDYTYLIGSDKISTELDSLVKAANEKSVRFILDYTYNDEHDPNQFYRRSDHYNFARRGVPIAFFFTGVHADYHRPTDTIEKLLFDRMVNIGRLLYTAGWDLASFPRLLLKNGSGSGYQQ
jgi:hypothetical protein